MNLSQARFARRTGGGRPGAPVCNPGQPLNGVGMLSGTSTLYNNSSRIQTRNTTQRTVNGLALLNNQGDRITRLERKLEAIEQQYALSTSGVELKVNNTARQIDLMNGEYRQQMKLMRSYIKQLEEKIKEIDGESPQVKLSNINTVTNKSQQATTTDQENITLEISDK